MSKPSPRSAIAGQFLEKNSVTTELATFRRVVGILKEKPEALRAIAVKAGITTAAGKLKKAYQNK